MIAGRGTIALQQVGPWLPPWRDLVLLHVEATASDELIAIWCSVDDRPAFLGTEEPGFSVPTASNDGGAPAIVTLHSAAGATTVLATLAALEVTRPQAHQLPGGLVLVVGAEAELPDQRTPNAIVVATNGGVLRRGRVPVGVIQATTSGAVWVGVSDIDRSGAAALVRIDPDLRSLEESVSESNPDGVSALNVVDETAWAYYPSAIGTAGAGAPVRLWSTEIDGAEAILVDEDIVALVGDGADRHRITLGRLGATALEPTGTAELVLPDGSALPPDALVLGRGSILHCIAGDVLYRYDLASR